MDDSDAVLMVGVADGTEHHRAERVRADLDPGSAESAVLQFDSPWCPFVQAVR